MSVRTKVSVRMVVVSEGEDELKSEHDCEVNVQSGLRLREPSLSHTHHLYHRHHHLVYSRNRLGSKNTDLSTFT